MKRYLYRKGTSCRCPYCGKKVEWGREWAKSFSCPHYKDSYSRVSVMEQNMPIRYVFVFKG